MHRLVLLSALACFVSAAAWGQDVKKAIAAREYVRSTAIYHGFSNVHPSPIAESQLDRDPQTSASSFVHAIRRQRAKILSPTQADHWEAYVAKRSAELKRLHDERNVLRAYFFACAWKLPAVQAGSQGKAANRELDQWLEAWMEIRLQEQVAHHRFCRDAWAILTDVQRKMLKAGDWDQHVKKSTGHKRNYFGDKVVIRAMGAPSNQEAFQAASKKFAEEHTAIRSTLLVAEANFRRVAFAIPALSDAELVSHWMPVDDAYRAYFMSQAMQIEGLTRGGYDLAAAGVRKTLVAQPIETMRDLDKKIELKLKKGKPLRDLLH